MNRPKAPRQTLSFLRRRFASSGVRPHQRRGQNFLIDLNLLELLVEAAELSADDVVLEIGTGTGSLTRLVAERVAVVITVELDQQLLQLASEELDGVPNIVMLRQDALNNKNRLHPRVLEEIGRQVAHDSRRRLKLVANLPYSIATPVISNLLAQPLVPVSMTVTVQKELADRIAARPSTKDYGALSIWIQSQCRVELVRVLPPSAFWPRPRVSSAIIRIVLDAPRREQIADRDFLHGFVRALFCHRRKLLRGVLPAAFKGQLTKTDADVVLSRFGLPAATRAEELDVATIVRLADLVRQYLQPARVPHDQAAS